MSFEVRALYDFDGEPNTAEMSIVAGEILTVTRTDVGEGWWEGVSKTGKSGLFPEAYVEKIKNSVGGPPQMPPPLYPQTPNLLDDWSSNTPPAQNVANNDNDGWDDDWDEDPYSEIQGNNQNQDQFSSQETNHNFQSKGDADTFSEASFGGIDNKGTVTKKSFNRFSTFVKSGGESYILGTLKVNVDDSRIIRIVKLDEFTFAWPPITPSNQYTVLVTSPKKETKLKGLKSFIAYQLTPSFNNIQVSRRYKHFDWLHERLCEKFSLIAVPPLPDKQISGRYEEHFIEHRRVQLQEFVNWVCRHPILSKSDVWQHFITCTDEKMWKQGKRAAERDPLQGANFCLCIEAPEKNLLSWVDEKMEINMNFVHNLDGAVKNLQAAATDQSRKYATVFKKEFCRIAETITAFGAALESADKAKPPDLALGIKRVGVAYLDIARIYDEQPKLDWEPLADKLYVYRGICSAFPDMFAIYKGSQQKRKECEKQNTPPSQLNEIRKRTDTVSYAIFAELNHFKSEREIDLKIAMRNFLNEQINFYKKIVDKLEESLKFFE